MGIDICHYADHDLPTDNIESFVDEFKKRVNSEKIVLEINDYIPNWDYKEDDVWYIFYDNREMIDIYHNQLDFSVYKKALDVFNIKIDGQSDCTRWNYMMRNFESDFELAKKWINGTVNFLKQNVVPIFHSTKLIVLADSFSDRHEVLYDNIIDGGKTIDEVLELNSKFEIPCKVYKNEQAIGIKESDYWDGEIGPIFLFDL